LGSPHRYKVLQWIHASEATYALHGITVLYIQWFQKGGDVAASVAGAAANIGKDLDFLEKTLGESEGKFILGDKVTAADVMMHFSAAFVLERGLHPGGKGEGWPGVRRWIGACEGTESYRAAVERTGHTFEMKF
jgi:glutathione S-transferase